MKRRIRKAYTNKMGRRNFGSSRYNELCGMANTFSMKLFFYLRMSIFLIDPLVRMVINLISANRQLYKPGAEVALFHETKSRPECIRITCS